VIYIGGLSDGLSKVDKISTLIVDASTPALVGLNGELQDRTKVLGWDGLNDNGQDVQGGYYVLVLETKDPYDKVTLTSVGIQVARADASSHLGIYNSAGERVAELPLAGKGPWSALQSSAHELVSGPGSVTFTAQGANGLETVVWNGTNEEGRTLESGTYYAKIESASGAPVGALAITVLKGPSPPGSAMIAPNPAKGDGAWLSWPMMPGALSAQFKLYNSAGELVQAQEVSAWQGRLWISGSNLAGGLYWGRLSWHGPSGFISGITLKWALAR
jgi:flagellar hook assembly protein FlgD